MLLGTVDVIDCISVRAFRTLLIKRLQRKCAILGKSDQDQGAYNPNAVVICVAIGMFAPVQIWLYLCLSFYQVTADIRKQV